MPSDSTTVQKWTEFVRRLVRASLAGQVVWKETPSVCKILTSVNDITVVLDRGEDDQGIYFRFTIVDVFDNKVDEFTEADLDIKGASVFGDLSPRGYPNWPSVLDEFFKIQRRRITGADQVIDELISSLPAVPTPSNGDLEDDEIPF